jgi:SAM-dependent methyltransferase
MKNAISAAVTIPPQLENGSTLHGVGFKLLNPNKPLPFEDSSYAVVTCLMCLHHVDDQPLMLRELFRVLKPRGMLVIREHDLDDNGMFPVIEIMHGMYDLVWSNPSQNPNFIQEYKAFYRFKTKWRTIASDVGFVVPYLERQPRHYGSYSNAQACNAYFDLFKKPLDASSLQKHFEFRPQPFHDNRRSRDRGSFRGRRRNYNRTDQDNSHRSGHSDRRYRERDRSQSIQQDYRRRNSDSSRYMPY